MLGVGLRDECDPRFVVDRIGGQRDGHATRLEIGLEDGDHTVCVDGVDVLIDHASLLGIEEDIGLPRHCDSSIGILDVSDDGTVTVEDVPSPVAAYEATVAVHALGHHGVGCPQGCNAVEGVLVVGHDAHIAEGR